MEHKKQNKKWHIEKENKKIETKRKTAKIFSLASAMRNLAIALLIIIATFTINAENVQAVNNLFALQGSAEVFGNPVNNGDLLITIWNAPTDGSLVYNSTTDYNSKINNGRFDVMLGDGANSLTLEYGKTYYLDMSINGQDLDFGANERQIMQSSVGQVNWSYIQNAPSYVRDYSSDISGKLDVADERYNETNYINNQLLNYYTKAFVYNKTESDARYLQSYSETDPLFIIGNTSIWTAINNKLNANDQRYNESDAINTQSARIDTLNSTKANAGNCAAGEIVQNITALGVQCVIDQTGVGGDGNNYPTSVAFNNSGDVYQINIARNGLGNITATFDISEYNDSSAINTQSGRIDTINQSLQNEINARQGIGNWSADKTSYNTTTQLDIKYLGITDQRYNDTSAINTKATPGNCPSGQVVQNTTNSGVQCISTGGAGTVTQISSGIYTTGGAITSTGTIDINTTALINSIGNWSADKNSYNTTNQLRNIFVNTSIISNCPSGQFIQNITSGSIQCTTPGATAETDPVFSAQNTSIWGNISAKLNANDQRYNETALINGKLDSTDQRYNESSTINTQITRIDTLNSTKAVAGNCAAGQFINGTSATGAPTCAVPSIAGDGNNYTTNVAFNNTGGVYQINIARSGMSNITATFDITAYNDSSTINTQSGRIDTLNSSLQNEITTRQGIGNWTADKQYYLNATADYTNDSQSWYSINNPSGFYNSSTIPAYSLISNLVSYIGNWSSDKLNYNTTNELRNVFLNLTDQRYNDTTSIITEHNRIDTLNTSKAAIGNCNPGDVIQNITATGIQCITPTASASAGGNDRSIQYNNGGAIDGANKLIITSEGNLNLENQSFIPATPTTGITLAAKQRAGETVFMTIGPSGIDKVYQPLMGEEFAVWCQAAGTATGTTAPLCQGTALAGTVGTVINPVKTINSVRGAMSWAVLNATAASYNEFKPTSTGLAYVRGNSSLPLELQNGGFKGIFTYYFTGNTAITGGGIGFTSITSATAFTSASNWFTGASSVNNIFVGYNGTQTNIGYWTNNATQVAKKIYDCGNDYNITNNNSVFRTTIFARPNGGNISFFTIRVDNASISPCEYVMNMNDPRLPLGNIPMGWRLWHGGVISATPASLMTGMNKIYVSTDN